MFRGKYLENEFFSRSGKSQGILWLVRETWKGLVKSGNLRNSSQDSLQKIYLFFSRGERRGERMYFLISLLSSPSSLGSTI